MSNTARQAIAEARSILGRYGPERSGLIEMPSPIHSAIGYALLAIAEILDERLKDINQSLEPVLHIANVLELLESRLPELLDHASDGDQ